MDFNELYLSYNIVINVRSTPSAAILKAYSIVTLIFVAGVILRTYLDLITRTSLSLDRTITLNQ